MSWVSPVTAMFGDEKLQGGWRQPSNQAEITDSIPVLRCPPGHSGSRACSLLKAHGVLVFRNSLFASWSGMSSMMAGTVVGISPTPPGPDFGLNLTPGHAGCARYTVKALGLLRSQGPRK